MEIVDGYGDVILSVCKLLVRELVVWSVFEVVGGRGGKIGLEMLILDIFVTVMLP